MALSTKELNTLLSLLSEETLRSSTLEQLAVIFNRNFTKVDHFRVGMALTVLLQEKDLLPQTMQRIAALYLVYEMHRTEPLPSNPLAPFLAELIQPTLEDGLPPVSYPNYILNSIEKTFLLQLATSPQSRELIKRSPLQIASVDPVSIPPPDTSALLALLQGSLSKVSQADMTGKNCILKDPDITATTHHDPTSAGQTAEDLLCGADVPSLEVFEPGLVRPAPPLHVSTNEATWLNPTDGQYDIQWDYNMCQSNTADSDVVKLMTKACSDVLPLSQQESLAKQIQSEPNIVYHSGLVPSKLPSLVENNPLIAYEALLQLMSSNQISEYLQTLVNMDMSLHSMEVVNRLTTAVDLPSEFIHLYITNCIQTCHNTKDKFMKSRLVRLVCVFLQSLIRNKIIRVEEHSTEIQQFCLEFSQIREATALFKLLKNMENPEAAKQL